MIVKRNLSKTASPAEKRRGGGVDLTPFWFLLPIIAVFTVMIAVPMMRTFYYSFTDYNGFSLHPKFIGLTNYKTVFMDKSILTGLGFTILFAVCTTFFITIFAILLAVELNKKFWGCNFARSMFFFFSVPSMALLGLVWRYIFSPLDTGVVNTVIRWFGGESVPWLSNSHLARFCVIFIAIWAQIGWHATLYIAYLQAIPSDLYEQAEVDGASSRQQFIHITLPQLMPGIVVSTFLLMNGGLKIYDLPFAMLNGGPGFATNTVTQSIIIQGISQGRYGIGSALSVLFTIAVAVVVFVQMGVSTFIEKRFE